MNAVENDTKQNLMIEREKEWRKKGRAPELQMPL